MKIAPTQLKQLILSKYQCRSRGEGFDALAARYGIQGGGRTIQRWYERWDGTPASLEPKRSTGRPTALSSTEVQQYITAPIKRENRRSHPIRYTDLLRPIREKTGKRVSLRTIQQYGKENAGINSRNTKKRTANERKYTHKWNKQLGDSSYLYTNNNFMNSLSVQLCSLF